MKFSEANRADFKQFSSFSARFGNQTTFAPFLTRPNTTIADLIAQAKEKLTQYSTANRVVLHNEMSRQLKDIASESQLKNLSLIENSNTVTVTTGHQLTLFGGPLYLVYKALHIAKLAEEFNAAQSEMNAVPIFWMASEDHDHDEISTAQLFNQELKWETTQAGPVGRMHLNDIETVWNQLKSLFEGKETEIRQLLDQQMTGSYADFMQRFLTILFADYGILVLQPDTHELKQLFIPVLEKELQSDGSFQAVARTNAQLQQVGLEPQANARSCNLFVLKDQARVRIDRTENGFAVDGTIYSLNQMMEWVETAPEDFSPNVILRPVYQETILPNIIYIGGGGEMAYWIQLKGVFEHMKTLYPAIQQRNSIVLLDDGTNKKMENLPYDWQAFALPKEGLKKQLLESLGGDAVDMAVIREPFEALHLAMVKKAKETDSSLESFAEAEAVRLKKQLENFEQRLVKQVKQQHDQSLKNCEFVAERLFPNGGLQERHYHWLHFAPSGDYKRLFQAIYTGIEPYNPNLLAIKV